MGRPFLPGQESRSGKGNPEFPCCPHSSPESGVRCSAGVPQQVVDQPASDSATEGDHFASVTSREWTLNNLGSGSVSQISVAYRYRAASNISAPRQKLRKLSMRSQTREGDKKNGIPWGCRFYLRATPPNAGWKIRAGRRLIRRGFRHHRPIRHDSLRRPCCPRRRHHRLRRVMERILAASCHAFQSCAE